MFSIVLRGRSFIGALPRFFPIPRGSLIARLHFLSVGNWRFRHVVEYHVDHRAKKAALFFLACGLNPDTRVKIPDAMRIKGYSNVEPANQLLQQQVRREAEKLKGEAIPCPPAPVAAAASALMALSATANVGRLALRMILPNPATMVAPFVTVGGGKAGILPSPERRVRKTSHQAQIGKQNERKR